VTQWITEYNYDGQDLDTTQQFYNESSEYYDRMTSVGRYSFFGSFRSKVSNVGVDATMLNNAGQLTDIGVWYLGLDDVQGVSPTSGAAVKDSPVGVAVLMAAGVGAAVLLG
jgi:hypothetical protein